MKNRIAKWRHLVELQSQIITRTTSGASTSVWQTYASAWAGFQPQGMSYSESDSLGGKRVSQERVLVSMRQRTDVLPKHRIKWPDGRIFDIIGLVNVFDLADEMVLSCVQVIS